MIFSTSLKLALAAAVVAGADPKLAAHEKRVFGFWRELFEAGHMALADKSLAESCIQHWDGAPKQ